MDSQHPSNVGVDAAARPGNGATRTRERRVLITLKRRGEATADELAAALEISTSAVRQHLTALRSADLITAHQARGQPGRPSDVFHATERAEPLFVTTDSALSIELLGHIEAEDPQLVDRIFERRRQQLVDDARGLDGKSTADRVQILTDLLDEQGYLADFEQVEGEHFRINLHNCPMWTVASRYRQVCTTELDFLRDLVPVATVQRLTHKTSGAHTCAYDITF